VVEQITLSPTRIRRWVRCKKSYNWRYNWKLIRIRKEVPMTLGSVIAVALAEYYRLQPSERSTEALTSTCLDKAIESNLPTFDPQGEGANEWKKIMVTSNLLLTRYHDWAVERDNFKVIEVETSRSLELTPKVHFLAIPDTIVVIEEDTQFVLEHKVRFRYRLGDFNLDYQSIGACLVTGSIGTIYNVLEYSKMKLHRTTHIRDKYELDYFRDMFIHIGEDILRTPPGDLYPMPMGRCHCEYFELCNAEQTNLDINDIIKELYMESHGREGVGKSKEPEEQE